MSSQTDTDKVINDAAKEILANRENLAVLIRVLNKVHLDGYGSGLRQGRYDATNPVG